MNLLKALALAGIVGGSSLSMAAAPLFTECPAIGANTGCGVLITINPDSSLTFSADSPQGPYDGVEDTLFGVVNNSSSAVGSFTLSSTTDIFGFDGDGISGAPYNAPGNSTDKSGYGGPKTFFTNIAANHLSGTVNFIGGLASGTSTYFSLEENLAGSNGTVGGGITGGGVVGNAPEPETYALMGAGLATLIAFTRRRRTQKA